MAARQRVEGRHQRIRKETNTRTKTPGDITRTLDTMRTDQVGEKRITNGTGGDMGEVRVVPPTGRRITHLNIRIKTRTGQKSERIEIIGREAGAGAGIVLENIMMIDEINVMKSPTGPARIQGVEATNKKNV